MIAESSEPFTEAELDALRAAETPEAWNAALAAIREARHGGYPCDWYARIEPIVRRYMVKSETT